MSILFEVPAMCKSELVSRIGRAVRSSSVEKSSIAGEPGILEYLPVSQLFVDESYQRKNVDKKHVNHIANNWDWRKVKCLNVAMRSDVPNMYAVYDGQHTCLAARKLGIEKLPCYIIQSDTVADEATGFVGINRDRKAVHMAAQFNAMVVAGDSDATKLQKIIDRHGVVLVNGKSTGNRQTQAIGALLKIMDEGKEGMLDRILWICMDAWDGDRYSLYNAFLRGLWSFISRIEHLVTDKEISDALRRFPAGTIHQQAMLLARAKVGGNPTDIWREVFLDCYNHKRRKENRISFDIKD